MKNKSRSKDALLFTEHKSDHYHENPRFNLWMFVTLYMVSILLFWQIAAAGSGVLNWYLTFAWALYFPFALLGILQVLRHKQTFARSRFQGLIPQKVIFFVPTICRHDTLPALKRVLQSISKYAPKNLLQWRIDVVVEETAEALPELQSFAAPYRHVRIVVVPASYETKNGTRHKSRANHFALEQRRNEQENTPDVYVYHLDDDTHVGHDTIASIAEFVDLHHGRHYLAQGVLTFPHELSKSWFARWADSIRPIDDITRFSFFTGLLGRPLVGLHGEHLLIRADVEDDIGWDFGDTLVEDAFFALRFSAKYPGRSSFLSSYTYGASPSSVKDLVKQRSRWAAGLLQLIVSSDAGYGLRERIILAYAVICWALGPFQYIGVVLALAIVLGVYNTSPIALWVLFIWCFNFTYFLWQYMEGLKINLSVSEKGEKPGILKQLAIIPMVYAFTAVEGYAAFLGLIKAISRQRDFIVIKKEL